MSDTFEEMGLVEQPDSPSERRGLYFAKDGVDVEELAAEIAKATYDCDSFNAIRMKTEAVLRSVFSFPAPISDNLEEAILSLLPAKPTEVLSQLCSKFS